MPIMICMAYMATILLNNIVVLLAQELLFMSWGIYII